MQFTKPALTIDDQAQLLVDRGLMAPREVIREKLTFINYYRFSSYLYPFRIGGSEDFIPGTTLEDVWQQYIFDRKLRLLVFNAIELIEIGLRTRLTYHFCTTFDPFAYLEIEHYPQFTIADDFTLWKEGVKEEILKSKDYAIQHFYEKYSPEHEMPPLWIASEFMTFGKVVTMYRKVEDGIRTAVAKDFGVPPRVFRSWMLTLNDVRNICAHHGRLWNRIIGTKPLLLKGAKYLDWEIPVKIPNDRMFGVLTIIQFTLRQIAPCYRWKERLDELIQEYSSIPLQWMGFPNGWEESPLWK